MGGKRRRDVSSSYDDDCCCCYCHRPEFFKVYLSDQRVRIPPAFLKYLPEGLPQKVILRSSISRRWEVSVNKEDGHLFLQEGWKEFAEYHSFEFGDFLVFCYVGNSELFVKIFGTNGCLKEAAIPNDQSADAFYINAGNNSTTLSLEDNEQNDEMALKKGNEVGVIKTEFVSKNPFFEIVLKPSYLQKAGYVHIPACFYHLISTMECGIGTFRAAKKTWKVKLMRQNGRFVFSKGWSKFVKDNALKESCVCLFELKKIKPFVLKVTIFKGLDSIGNNPITLASMEDNEQDDEMTEKISSSDGVTKSKSVSENPFCEIVLKPS